MVLLSFIIEKKKSRNGKIMIHQSGELVLQMHYFMTGNKNCLVIPEADAEEYTSAAEEKVAGGWKATAVLRWKTILHCLTCCVTHWSRLRHFVIPNSHNVFPSTG